MVGEMGERMVKLFKSSGLRDIMSLLRWKYGDRAHGYLVPATWVIIVTSTWCICVKFLNGCDIF